MSISLCQTLASVAIDAYQSSLKMYDDYEPASRGLYDHLIGFDQSLYHGLLQVETGQVRSQEALKKDEVDFLKTYWEFHSSMVKTIELMNFLRERMQILDGLIRNTSQLKGCIQQILILQNQVKGTCKDRTLVAPGDSEILYTLTEIEKMTRECFDRILSCHQHLEGIYQQNSQPMRHIGFKMMKFSYFATHQDRNFSEFIATCDLTRGPIVRRLTPTEAVFGDYQLETSGVAGCSSASGRGRLRRWTIRKM